MVRIISRDSLLEELRRGQHRWHRQYSAMGEMHDVEIQFNDGQALAYELPHPLSTYFGAQGELMTVPANIRDLVEKVVVDLEIAMATAAPVYGPIYRTINDANFPQIVDVGPLMGYTGVVFLERREGEEIHWGTRAKGEMQTVPLRSFALGFQWTKELVMFDQTWRFQDMTTSIGTAHTALLNHLHLRPILDYAYPPGNITTPDFTAMADLTPEEQLWTALTMAVEDAALDINPDTGMGRHPTLILTHSSNTMAIRQALGGMERYGAPALPAITGLSQIVEYDQQVIAEGERRYVYPGCDPASIWLVEPRTYFIELVRQALQIEQGPEPDFSRYIIGQLRADTWRGVVAAPASAVQVLTMPTLRSRRLAATAAGGNGGTTTP